MEKLTTILVFVPRGGSSGPVFEKMLRLAGQFDAQVEFFLAAASDYFAFAGRRATLEGATDYTISDGSTPLARQFLRRAAEIGADLLMVPRAQLDLEGCAIPILMLSETSWAGEPRFAAAVDVSNDECAALTRGILHVAGFLAQRFLAHVDILYAEREQHDHALRMERAVRLARLVREYHVGCELLQVFDGPPERVLPRLIADRRYDALLVGVAPHHGALSEFHSVAGKLTAATAGDVVLVAPAAEPDAQSARQADPRSARQQLAHQA